MKISAVVLTKNEEKNIERCLKSLDFCDEIIIIDDYSEDETINKIKNLKLKIKNYNSKLKIVQRKLEGDFSEQKNFGMEKASNEWVLFLDGDEEVSEDLKKEIEKVICYELGVRSNTFAFYIKRRDFFWGREVKFGEVKKIRQIGLIRLVKKNSGKWVGKVHEQYQISNKYQISNIKYQILKLKSFINHYPHQNLKEFIQDINYYSSLRAEELFEMGKKTNIFQIVFYPLFKFILTYFLYLGFLDGTVGFVYSFMMSFHSFLVRSKLYQLTNIDK